MRLMWLIAFVALDAYNAVNGISNDIVGSMRCRLICKEADSQAAELKDSNICRCIILKKLNDHQLAKVQELSTFYNLPVLFENERRHSKVKRQLNANLLGDWRETIDDQWAEAAENIKAWREQQAKDNPLLGNIADHAENLKSWHEHQVADNPLIENFGEHAENLKNWHKQQIEENPVLGDIQESAANIQAWHKDNLDILQESIQEQKNKFEEHMDNLKSGEGPNLGPVLEEHAEKFKKFHEEHIEPIVGAPLPSLDDYKEKLRSFQNSPEPILGQMAPQLTTYDSKQTGVGFGAGKPSYPPAVNWNPMIPPLAHIIDSLHLPQFYYPLPGGVAPNVAAPHYQVPALPHLFSRSAAGKFLPEKYNGPYNPHNPIVVQPIIVPSRDSPTPRPILSSLRNNVDDMLANMKKNGGRLIPENYLNSDALSNSESQVNQINVNVRVEPTPTPPNIASWFWPYGGRNWLAAPAPKELDENDQLITENPGVIEDSEEEDENKRRNKDNDDETENSEEERRMEKQLKDADKSTYNAHVVDSVKKNLPKKGIFHSEKEQLKGGKYGNSLIVQPPELMSDSEEDLDTLAK